MIGKWNKLLFIIGIGILSSCSAPSTPANSGVTSYIPVLLDEDKLVASTKYERSPDQTMPIFKNVHEIVQAPPVMLILEQYKGVHFINNNSPSSPLYLGYMSIPGCVDMEIADGILYVDNATDILSIDISFSNPKEPVIRGRTKSILPELPPPDGGNLPLEFQPGNRPAGTVIIEWVNPDHA